MTPIILCESVCVAYGRQEVLHAVDLAIPRGILLPFVGANGSGKTTLLRAILGLIPVRHGRIVTPFHRKPPGYVPQQRVIDPFYPVSARRIIEMGLYPANGWWRRPDAAQGGRIDAILDRLGLSGHQHKTFAELSGGMRQKTLLARALATDAEVYIMDEPTSELDERSEAEVLGEFRRLVHEEGRTVLMAYHGLDHAAGLSERICRIARGRAEIVDTATARADAGEARRSPGGGS
ncbi:MAG: metal ABC transporter ATP-binding protein [Lentisphaerae bacterium]|nr:metal ABC transporter ATP-binding protein [Lentisphaerota bacterium]